MTFREQIDSFYQYATAQVQREQCEPELSIDEVYEEWRQSLHADELLDLLNRRHEAAKRGETIDFDEFMSRMYEKHGLNDVQ